MSQKGRGLLERGACYKIRLPNWGLIEGGGGGGLIHGTKGLPMPKIALNTVWHCHFNIIKETN